MSGKTDLSHRGGIPVARLRPDTTLFDRIGGRDTVGRVVDGLYDRIETDETLRPMFVRNLTDERAKQKAFWEEWLGGESRYTHHHAYSGLRQRHAHIHITPAAAEQWLTHFAAAWEQAGVGSDLRDEVMDTVRPIALSFVNERDPPSKPGHLRCHRSRRFRAVKRLAEKGDTQGVRNALQDSPRLLEDGLEMAEVMQAAAARGRTETVAGLIESGVDPNQAAHWKAGCIIQSLMLTPLCVALARKKTGTADLLRERGAVHDVFTAAYLGDAETLAACVADDPDVLNAPDPANDVLVSTPLYHAVYGGHTELVAWMLAEGAKVGENSTAMVRHAANAGDFELTRLLVEAGADATRVGPGGWVTDDGIADLLCAHGADVNYPHGEWIWRSCTGNNSQRDDPDLVAALIARGADVDTRLRGATALHYTSKAGFLEATNVLLENGADANAVSDTGETPLFYALKAGKRADVPAVCRLLLQGGADPLREDGDGVTALQRARRRRRSDRDEIVDVLSEARDENKIECGEQIAN